MGPLGLVEPLVKGPGSLLVDGEQPFPTFPSARGAPRLRHGHARPLGQHGHRVPEGKILQLHDEVDGPAALAAAEALVDLPVWDHVEGGSFFAVKGAAAPVAVSLFGQPDRLGHQVHQIGAGQQLVQKLGRPGHKNPPPFRKSIVDQRVWSLSKKKCKGKDLSGSLRYFTLQDMGMNSLVNCSMAKGSVKPAM